MVFTYYAYEKLIDNLADNGFTFVNYDDYADADKCVILRHDIDFQVEKAFTMAELEQMKGVKSTYFVLLSTSFYNVAEKNIRKTIQRIHELGHDIGLHFDERNYDDEIDVVSETEKEARILECLLDIPIKAVSMHRPSPKTLEANYQFPTLTNTYGQLFFQNFKYVSDSRHHWKEDIEDIVGNGKYQRLHILTHPIWYNEQELTIEECLSHFLSNAKAERYSALSENIRDFESIIPACI